VSTVIRKVSCRLLLSLTLHISTWHVAPSPSNRNHDWSVRYPPEGECSLLEPEGIAAAPVRITTEKASVIAIAARTPTPQLC
jgi:hypothetical protein